MFTATLLVAEIALMKNLSARTQDILQRPDSLSLTQLNTSLEYIL